MGNFSEINFCNFVIFRTCGFFYGFKLKALKVGCNVPTKVEQKQLPQKSII